MRVHRIRVVAKKNVVVAESIHPIIDLERMLSMLMPPTIEFPVIVLKDDNIFFESTYIVKTGRYDLPYLHGLLMVGPSKLVSTRLSNYVFSAPNSSTVIEAISREKVVVEKTVKRFPRVMVIVSQLIPGTIVSGGLDGVLMKKYRKLMRYGAIPFHRLLRLFGDQKYGENRYVIDMRPFTMINNEEIRDKFEGLYATYVTDNDLVTFFFVSNAYVLPNLFRRHERQYTMLVTPDVEED